MEPPEVDEYEGYPGSGEGGEAQDGTAGARLRGVPCMESEVTWVGSMSSWVERCCGPWWER